MIKIHMLKNDYNPSYSFVNNPVLWGDYTGPNELPFVFRIRKWGDLLNWPNVPTSVFPNASPNVFRLLSECFQYGFRMLSELTESFPHVDFERFPFRTLSVCFPNAFRTRRIDLEWTELFPHAFWKRSERLRHLLCPFGKHTEHTVPFGSSENVLKGYWKRSESIRHVIGPFGVFGKHTEPSN